MIPKALARGQVPTPEHVRAHETAGIEVLRPCAMKA